MVTMHRSRFWVASTQTGEPEIFNPSCHSTWGRLLLDQLPVLPRRFLDLGPEVIWLSLGPTLSVDWAE